MDAFDILYWVLLVLLLFFILGFLFGNLFVRWYIKRQKTKRMGELSNENIFDIYAWIAENDETEGRLYFDEADAVMDRYMVRLTTSEYVLRRLWEIKCQLEESQETQSV